MNINPAEIKQIVLTDPTVLKHILRNPNYDKRKITGIISQMFKYDVGLEFELFGSLSHLSKIKIRGTDKSKERNDINKNIAKILRIVSYSEDHYHNKSLLEQKDLNELRIRLRGHLGLVPLYNSLNYMRESCMIPKNSGGIHIHVDCNRFLGTNDDRNLLCNWFSKPEVQNRVLDIFGGYEGTYNKPGCKVRTKGYYVNISRLDTVEFRIGKLTFDYPIIANWIYKCQQLVKEGLRQTRILAKTKVAKTETVINAQIPTREYMCIEEDECEPDDYVCSSDVNNNSSSYTSLTFNTTSNSNYVNLNDLERTLINQYSQSI